MRKLIQQIGTLLLGICSAGIVYVVTQEQIAIFKHALFVKRSFVNADSIVQNFFAGKSTMSVVLLVLGLACYMVYFMAIEDNSFLHVTGILFLSAAVLCTAWERDTIFYLDSFARVCWIKGNHMLWISLTVVCYSLLLKGGTLVEKLIKLILWINASGFMIRILLSPAAQAFQMAKVYTWMTAAVSAGLLVWFALNHKKRGFWFPALLLGLMSAMNVKYLALRQGVDVREQTRQLQMFLYLLLILNVLIFFEQFRTYRSRIFYDKRMNRRLSELDRYKNEMIEQITDIIQKPVEIIHGLNGLLLEKKEAVMEEEERFILEKIRSESEQIRRSMEWYRSNAMLVRDELKLDRMKVGIRVIFQNVFDILQKENPGIHDAIQLPGPEHEVYIYGDPYLFMESQINLFRELYDICREDETIRAKADYDENKIRVKFFVPVAEDAHKRARRMMKIFREEQMISADKQEELPLIFAHNLLISQCERMAARIEEGNLFIWYEIPVWEEQLFKMQRSSLENQEDETLLSGKHRRMPVVILVSTLPEQIELIRTYSMRESYRLKVFNTGEDALSYIEKHPLVAVIFIGTTFERMTTNQICDKIRKRYSLGQLPIILIRPYKRRNVQENIRQHINDILEEPFSREDFLLKVSMSMYLKKSVEEALVSRMDFLQSQMDPHFIFNTISTILPLCLENPGKAYDLLVYFSDYLRGSLFGNNLFKEVGIEQEINLVNAYLAIEEVRFGENIRHSIHCNCMDDPIRILPLSIEPLVENAVKHGRNKEKPLEIRVDIIREEEWVYVQVQDNGMGMTQERIHEIQGMNDEKSIGLANLIRRLKMYYREDLLILSERNEGTTISFRIPADSGNEERYTGIFDLTGK